MRTLQQLAADPHSPLTKEELDNFDAIMMSGRTDGRPHEEFEYDPDTGIELPGTSNPVAKALSKSKCKMFRRIGAWMRWNAFHRRFRMAVDRIIKDGSWLQ